MGETIKTEEEQEPNEKKEEEKDLPAAPG